jgi:hypothetical protein
MWRIFVCPRLNLPLAVFLKRLAAPEWVFNFGMGKSWLRLEIALTCVFGMTQDNLPSITGI